MLVFFLESSLSSSIIFFICSKKVVISLTLLNLYLDKRIFKVSMIEITINDSSFLSLFLTISSQFFSQESFIFEFSLSSNVIFLKNSVKISIVSNNFLLSCDIELTSVCILEQMSLQKSFAYKLPGRSGKLKFQISS